MDKSKIETRLSEGSGSAVLSTSFSRAALIKLARAAYDGNTTLTIIVGDNLSDWDIDKIREEAPRNVVFDYSRCNFPKS